MSCSRQSATSLLPHLYPVCQVRDEKYRAKKSEQFVEAGEESDDDDGDDHFDPAERHNRSPNCLQKRLNDTHSMIIPSETVNISSQCHTAPSRCRLTESAIALIATVRRVVAMKKILA